MTSSRRASRPRSRPFRTRQSILNLRSAYKNAADNGVTVLAGSGDAGPTGAKTLTSQGFAATFFLRRVAEWPADDPLVTGVGGLELFLNANGKPTQPPAVWNDTALFGSPAASGGGLDRVLAPVLPVQRQVRCRNRRAGFPTSR